MLAMRGEQLGVVTNWPPSLEAALQRWGTISPKAPCLTTMDTNGKPLYILTYGNPHGPPAPSRPRAPARSHLLPSGWLTGASVASRFRSGNTWTPKGSSLGK